MTTPQVVGYLVLLCVFGAAIAKDYNVQRNLDLLERKMADIAKKETEQQAMIEELTNILHQQGNKLNMLEDENKNLKKKMAQVQRQRDSLLTNDASRARRQISNSSYEGPIAFMTSLGSKCENNLGVNQNIAFKSVMMNLGGAYNALHGVFLVPRDGVYLFSSSLVSDSQSHSTNVHAAISVNGNKAAKILAISEANRHRDQGSNTLIADLKKGDQVWVKNVDNNDATICGINGFSTFSGYLLYPY